jgi:2',3'-cyclic-nucleotide 2'-phosphodiesterase (5'-nucleotidase family)
MKPIEISIFHINDMHGRLEAMSRLSSFARRLRAEAEVEGRQTFF